MTDVHICQGHYHEGTIEWTCPECDYVRLMSSGENGVEMQIISPGAEDTIHQGSLLADFEWELET